MRLIDISVTISPDLPVWPGDGPVVLEQISHVDAQGGSNVSRLECTVHTGTHLDAPLHFIENGLAVDEIPLKQLIGRAYVVDLTGAESITAGVLDQAGIPPRTRRILIKTRNSEYWASTDQAFREDYVAVDPSGAHWLVRKGVQLVGVDYLSVAAYADPAPTHRILLGSNVLVLEGLNLFEVEQGRYTLYCLPLKIMKGDGAPVRAVLAGV